MKILGIDPGFGKMGYAVVEKNRQGEKLIEAGCIETDAKTGQEKRLAQIGKKIEKIVKKHKPQALAIEKLYFAKNQKTALKVAEAIGVILYIAAQSKMPVYEYAPLEIKSSLAGYGRADKNQLKKIVGLILKTEKLPKIDDAVDAIAIALVGLSRVYPQLSSKPFTKNFIFAKE